MVSPHPNNDIQIIKINIISLFHAFLFKLLGSPCIPDCVCNMYTALETLCKCLFTYFPPTYLTKHSIYIIHREEKDRGT